MSMATNKKLTRQEKNRVTPDTLKPLTLSCSGRRITHTDYKSQGEFFGCSRNSEWEWQRGPLSESENTADNGGYYRWRSIWNSSILNKKSSCSQQMSLVQKFSWWLQPEEGWPEVLSNRNNLQHFSCRPKRYYDNILGSPCHDRNWLLTIPRDFEFQAKSTKSTSKLCFHPELSH